MSLQRNALVSLFLVLPWVAVSEPDWRNLDWSQKKESKGITVYTAAVPDSPFMAVWGVTEAPVRIASLVALVRDSAACPDWADLCKYSEVKESLGPHEEYVYTHNDLPWPVSDRDVLAHVTWRRDDSGAVTMLSVATKDRLPENRGLVRLTDAAAAWVFTPLPNGNTRVETMAHVDPAGPVPAWITNLMLVDSPFNTLKRLIATAATAPYAEVPDHSPLVP